MLNLPERLLEKINHYYKKDDLSISDNKCEIPADCRYIDHLKKEDQFIQIVSGEKEFTLLNNNRHTRSGYYAYKSGKNLLFSKNLSGSISCGYLRSPLISKWTYQVVGGAEIFNPSDSNFQDVDMHISEKNNLVIKVLLKFGINLKETDVQQISKIMENEEFKEENTL